MAGNLVQWVHQTLLTQQAEQCPDAPTAPPSQSPTTTTPTVAPTARPSTSPPTVAPTARPSSSAPSVAPTCAPTQATTHDAGLRHPCPFRPPVSPDYTGRLAVRLVMCVNFNSF